MDTTALYELYLQHPSVQTDTRKLAPGDIFFALKGPSFNGNTFAKQALEAGAAYAVVDEAEYAAHNRCILVPNVLETLQDLARHHRKQLNIPFIAITGSNGKTTTKELMTAVLSTTFRTSATEGNFNNHIGIPLTILKIPKDAEMAIIEMGANHQREIAGYCTIALPTHGIITNCGKAHLEGFGGEDGIRKGKGELYDYLRQDGGAIFRNTDLDYLKEMAQGITAQITYGRANARFTGTPNMNGPLLDVFVTLAGSDFPISTQLVGDYNFPNVMAALAVGLHFCVTLDDAKRAIEQYAPDNSRSQWTARGSNRIILDAYNANPTSMRAAIKNFAGAKLPSKRLWLGAMKEMGSASAEEHRELVALIRDWDWEEVILVGDEFEPFKGPYFWFANADEAAEWVKSGQPEASTILIKGSRGSRMETLFEALADG